MGLGDGEVLTQFGTGAFRGIAELKRIIFTERLSGQLTNIMYSMNDSAADFMPHQFKPVIKFLESASERLLIADEVGLGKTVEAIYIWKELVARRNARRMLIVSPAMLTQKWHDDLQRFFAIPSSVVKAEELTERITAAVHNPAESFVLVTSLEGIRNANTDKRTRSSRLNALLAEVAREGVFDLVVIDEAHYLRNRSTASFKTGERLRDASKALVLLSATPIQTTSENLFNLLNLLSPEDFPNKTVFECMLESNQALVKLANALDCSCAAAAEEATESLRGSYLYESEPALQALGNDVRAVIASPEKRIAAVELLKSKYFYTNYVTRSRKRDVYENIHLREAHTHYYSLTEREKELYDRISKWLKEKTADEEGIAVFRLIARQRQMASSLPAAFTVWEQTESMQELLYEDFGMIPETEAPMKPMRGGKNAVSDLDIAQLKKLDSKYKTLKKTIQEIVSYNPDEKIVVFSYFRATITYLHERLNADGFPAVRIMGGMGEEKNTTIAQFKNDPAVRVLISSEVGSEGIDLQFSSVEINYDLPWNPMRLEQRIGRIDRIAQKAPKIRIYNLICQNTIEDKILERLYDRIEIFKTSIGDIEEILGNTIEKLAVEIFNPALSETEIQSKANMHIDAVLKNKHATETLEAQAGNLTVFRDYILQSVNAAYAQKRYITPEELLFTVETFLREQFPDTKAQREKKYGMSLAVNLSARARRELRDFVQSEHSEYATRLVNAYGDVICCFDKKQIFANEVRAEIIDITHPLLRWIGSALAAQCTAENSCSCVTVKANQKIIPQGRYTYQAYVWNYAGAKNISELQFFVGNVATGEIFSGDCAEKIIHRVLRYGKDYKVKNVARRELSALKKSSERVAKQAEKSFAAFVQKEKGENDLLVGRQLYYTNRVADESIKKLEQLIAQMEKAGRPESIIRMPRGRRKKLIAERAEKISALEQKLSVRPELRLLAAGILVVT